MRPGLVLMSRGSVGADILIPLATLLILFGEAAAFDCRRFVFAPVCRGVTSKRSSSALAKKHLDIQIPSQNLSPYHKHFSQGQNLNHLLQLLAENHSEEYEDQNEDQSISNGEFAQQMDADSNLEEIQKSLHNWLDNTFSYHDKEGQTRMKRNALDSFTTFYLPKFGQKAEERFKRDLLKTFSTFYLPPTTKEARRDKRHVLNSFTTFFKSNPNAPAAPKNDRLRRNILDSFSTFSSPRVNSNGGRTKRESLDYFSSFYLPKVQDRLRSKRNILESFNGFYLPKGKKDVLDTFTSFYKNGNRNKRDIDQFIPIDAEEIDPETEVEMAEPVLLVESDRSKREILDPFTSFYKVKNPKNARGKRASMDEQELFENEAAKRNNLGTFTSFYLPKVLTLKDQNRNKRDAEDSLVPLALTKDLEGATLNHPESAESDAIPIQAVAEDEVSPMEKKNNIDSFTSFYLPKLKLDPKHVGKRSLNSFSNFYLPKA